MITPRIFLPCCLAALCLGIAPAADPPARQKPAFTNRLAKEKSPYLLQHAHNPVDWYPWGDEAFEKARKENKPVLLSIGYATCHWCHVMERESFQNEKVAAVLNSRFVAIKLDREERPDLDNIYMTAAQAMQVGGGWPLNMFLTPDRQPFFGGTYFPPKGEGGRPGFAELLDLVASRWEKEGAEIRKNAVAMTDELRTMMTSKAPAGDGALDPEWIAKAAGEFLSQYDEKHGGFSKAPKFPQPAVVSLVLRHAVKSKDAKALAAVAHTCDRMAAGGMYDQLGGGFARYSVDDKWLVPHFEKMLYDNAQLASLYLDVAVATGEKRFEEVARGIFRYVLRDMALPDGGFASAEDADSEGHEGKFYCWTLDEVKKLLGPEEAAVAIPYWGLTEKGNFVDHSHPEPLPNQNILHIADPAKKLTPAEAKRLEAVRSTLLEARGKRIRPLRDDKVLASWNGLMLSALAKGAVVLGDDTLLAAARKNAAFITAKMYDPSSKTLSHRWREGERDKAQLQKSYALVLQGMLDLYQADPNPATLEFALALAESMTERFYDKEHGGFFQSAEQPGLIVRSKDEFDDVEPSGNGAAIVALTRLAVLTDRPEWRERATKSARLVASRIKESPTAFPYTLQAVPWLTGEPFRVVITGDPSSESAKKLRQAAFSVYQPDKVVLGVEGPVEPFAKTLPAPKDGLSQAFVCTGKDCRLPTSDPKDVAAYLSGKK